MMSDKKGTDNLVVLTFAGSGTAAAAYEQIMDMDARGQAGIKDAIIVERGEDAEQPASAAMPVGSGQTAGVVPVSGSVDAHVRVIQTHGKKGKYAAGGGGIGFLAGFLLGGPIGGLAIGAGLGALTAALKDFGIDNDKIAAIKARLQPDSSALLLLGRVEDRDLFVDKLRTFEPQVFSSTLTPELEEQLRDRLAGAA
jgi:uncharacterized membrane protein